MLGWWLPSNLSIDGTVFHLLYWSSALVMVVAQLVLARSAVRGTRIREVVWALVPTLLLLSLGTVSQRATNALAASRQEVALERASATRHGR